MILLIPVFTFSMVYFFTPVFKKLALRFGVLDYPGQRKMHKVPTPLFGGVSVYIGVILGLVFNYSGNLHHSLGLVAGGTIILITGLIDDIRGLSANFRIIVQFLAAILIISFGLRLSFLPNNLWGDIGEIFLTVLWTIGITNSVNYLDGIDGLAAGTAAISALFFSIISYFTGQVEIHIISLVLLAGCLGFMPHNLKKDKIFLGDAGSTFIGFMMAGLAIMGNWAEDNIVKITIPVLILGVPIFDMVFTTVMRIKEKKVHSITEWLKYGGKDHFHHRLISLGLHHWETLFFIYSVNIFLGISAIMVGNEKAMAGILSVLQASIVFALIAILMVIGGRREGSAG